MLEIHSSQSLKKKKKTLFFVIPCHRATNLKWVCPALQEKGVCDKSGRSLKKKIAKRSLTVR
jgi:hypothetical protein